jgi:hypothetical protein
MIVRPGDKDRLYADDVKASLTTGDGEIVCTYNNPPSGALLSWGGGGGLTSRMCFEFKNKMPVSEITAVLVSYQNKALRARKRATGQGTGSHMKGDQRGHP